MKKTGIGIKLTSKVREFVLQILHTHFQQMLQGTKFFFHQNNLNVHLYSYVLVNSMLHLDSHVLSTWEWFEKPAPLF